MGELNGRYTENSALCLQLVCKFKIIQNEKNYIKKTSIDFNLVFHCLFSPYFSTHTLSKKSQLMRNVTIAHLSLTYTLIWLPCSLIHQNSSYQDGQ